MMGTYYGISPPGGRVVGPGNWSPMVINVVLGIVVIRFVIC